jgi:hypothetical protein
MLLSQVIRIPPKVRVSFAARATGLVKWLTDKTVQQVARIIIVTRSFTLSNKIDRERISALLDDGVLTMTLPKAQETKPRRISIG